MKWLVVLLLVAPFVCAATLQEAKDAYFNSTLEVQHLSELGYPTQSLEDALTEMHDSLAGVNISRLVARADVLNQSNETEKTALAQQLYQLIDASLRTGVPPGVNYTFVVEKAAWISSMRQKAFESFDLISNMNATLGKANETLNLSAVYETMAKAGQSFKAERYDEIPPLMEQARRQLEDAQVEAARERAFLMLARRNVLNYVQDHWMGLLLALVIANILALWAYCEIRLYSAIRTVHRLNIELAANARMAKETQENYYSDHMGASTYRTRMDNLKQKNRRLKTSLQVWTKLAQVYRKYALIMRFKQL